ncbi:bone marrow proteoglycan [Heliangelus exortis]|uniref:bone marrow proteoglycan n=1 Tax=Heliangelus exortis TaxID=472823 RepID=UPI003A955FB8
MGGAGSGNKGIRPKLGTASPPYTPQTPPDSPIPLYPNSPSTPPGPRPVHPQLPPLGANPGGCRQDSPGSPPCPAVVGGGRGEAVARLRLGTRGPVPAIRETASRAPSMPALRCIPACSWPWPCWAQLCPAPLRVCARQYGGHLAAIHSAATNAALWAQARLSNCGSKFWIGAVTKPWHRSAQCHWVDRTRWDFSNWQPGHPLCRARSCTSLCTTDGHWRSQSCKQRLPFICEC